ncbi:hypothetical protein [Pseudorhodoferax sp. Leaf265]|uniref:hypothetical protein n=1 Tax=Pseudorhodoferax sp. Leaf265 TaxID=1736315 RepID=UPI00070052C2|nr:hypothetical protein [Pseudorhodoferax sp. Leaf265]KQP02493.1 hypothetical protein ASF45_20785 [Pseudorhodoferax sp. Leaf265]
MQSLPRNFHNDERDRFWARKKKEHEMDIPQVVVLPIQAIEQGRTYAHNNRLETSFQMTEAQLRDTAATALECMKPAARALLLEQIKEAA